jgi:hypothetical protein
MSLDPKLLLRKEENFSGEEIKNIPIKTARKKRAKTRWRGKNEVKITQNQLGEFFIPHFEGVSNKEPSVLGETEKN